MSSPIQIPDEEIFDNYIKKCNITESSEIIFIQETFYGILRFKKLIQATLDLFYKKSGGRYLKNEFTLFSVLIYLAMIRLEELKFKKYSCFIRAFDPIKMGRLIGFLFDPASLEGDLKTLWVSILDADYVSEHILSPLHKNLQDAQVLLSDLCKKADQGLIPEKSQKKPTIQKPFELTIPNPRKLPIPNYVIPVSTKANPVPEIVFKGTNDRNTLELIKEENYKKSLEKYHQAQNYPFSVAIRNSSLNLEKHRTEIGSTLQKEFEKTKPIVYRKVPQKIYASIPVKLTTASILREDVLVRKQREKEQKWMQDVEIGLKDEKEFETWKNDLEIKVQEEKKLELEKRKIEIRLLHEETYLSKQEKLQENKEKVQEAIADKEAMKVISEQTKNEIKIENKKKIEKIHEIQECIQEAKSKILSENIKNASEMILELQAQKEEAAKLAKEELAKKMELIKLIRLLEKNLPALRITAKKVNLTETSGQRILGEMSIMELLERLTKAKVQHQIMEEEKRNEIKKMKQEKLCLLEEKMKVIDQEREKRKVNRVTPHTISNVCNIESATEVKRIKEEDQLIKLKKKLDEMKLARISKVQEEKIQQKHYKPSGEQKWKDLDNATADHARKKYSSKKDYEFSAAANA